MTWRQAWMFCTEQKRLGYALEHRQLVQCARNCACHRTHQNRQRRCQIEQKDNFPLYRKKTPAFGNHLLKKKGRFQWFSEIFRYIWQYGWIQFEFLPRDAPLYDQTTQAVSVLEEALSKDLKLEEIRRDTLVRLQKKCTATGQKKFPLHNSGQGSYISINFYLCSLLSDWFLISETQSCTAVIIR